MAQRSWLEQVALAAERGRALLARQAGLSPGPSNLPAMCERLLKVRGEAIGLALATNIVDTIQHLSPKEAADFLEVLERRFDPAPDKVEAAIQRWHELHTDESLRQLAQAVEPPRRELFRLLNMVPGATSVLMHLRAQLLELLPKRPHLAGVDADFRHLFAAWFSRGILRLEQITWHTSADVLERLIEYEAVHEIQGWDDLRGRLAADRRCFAFFHPTLPDEPLIFVEIALTRGIPGSIGPLIDPQREIGDPHRADSAIFYSINNCQDGLRGISFGNFLIKQVVQELSAELPQIKTFCTLSPLPNFAEQFARRGDANGFTESRIRALVGDDAQALRWIADEEPDEVRALERLLGETAPYPGPVDDVLRRLTLAYLLKVRRDKRVADSVAHFHLSNGARLERINTSADLSENGRLSFGVMVNYLYEPDKLELNHEQYIESGRLALAPAMSTLAKRIDSAWADGDHAPAEPIRNAGSLPAEA
jgi:malonyl-CoA decarboxylase